MHIKDQKRAIVDRLVGGPPDTFQPLCDFDEPWRSIYRCGTLFGAAPGAGKSLIALDLARRIIHGGSFPGGAPVPCPGASVLIVDAEGPSTLFNQRAAAFPRRTLYWARQALAGFVVDLGTSAHDPRKRWALAPAPARPHEGPPPHEAPPSQEPPPHGAA
jgi:hypothetical protein